MGKTVAAVASIGLAIAVPFAAPIVGAAIVGAGAPAALATAVGTIALTGASFALGALGRPSSPTAGLPEYRRLSLTDATSEPRKMVFGRTAMATDLMYQEPSGSGQEYVDTIVHVASHKVAGIDEIRFGDKVAWKSIGGVQGEFAGYLTVWTITEGGAGAYHTVNGGGKWGAAQRLTGCASVHFRFKRTGNSKKTQSPFAASIPTQAVIVGRGMPVYSPALDSTRGGSGSHRWNDQSTWEYVHGGVTIGENVALQALAWQIGWRINGKVSVGMGLPEYLIDFDEMAASAAACDEAVTLAAGGTQRRYLGGGLVTDYDSPQDTMQNFADACNGEWVDRDGKMALRVAVNDLAGPHFTVTPDDIGVGGISLTPYADIGQRHNIVRGVNPDPDMPVNFRATGYQPAMLPSLDGIDRTYPLNLAWVQDKRQTQRIARQVLQRRQYLGEIHAALLPRCLQLEVGDVVTVDYPPAGINGTWRVRSVEINPETLEVQAILRVENASIYAWDRDEQPEPTPGAPITYDPQNNPYLAEIAWSEVADDGGKPEDGATRNVYRGAHDSGTAYDKGDTVTNAAGDEVYVAIQDVPAGKALADAAYWSLMVSAGGGAPGINTATIFLYQRTATDSPPSLPASTLTYNFGTMGLSGPLGSWSRAMPTSGGAFRWVTTATASSATATDSIAPAEWAPAALQASDGLNTAIVTLYRRSLTTPTMPTGTFTYTFASGVLSGGNLNGWAQSHQPSDGTPEWTIQASAVGVGATDSIGAVEFSAPVQLVADGKDYRADIRDDFSEYADIADVRRHWDITDAGLGPANASLMAGAGYTGGMRVQVTGRAHFVAKQKYAFDAEDLYRVKARVYVETVGSGNKIYVGAKMMDLNGSNLPSDAGTLHYFGAENVLVTSTGWKEFEGYFRGTALIGSGNNVGRARPDPSTPGRAASGSVAFSPAVLINSEGTGGKASLDFIEIKKVEDLTPLPSRPWAAGVLQQRGQVVTFGGRSWIARVDNTNVQPPSTGTGNATWALLADKGVDGTPGRDAVVFFQDATPVGAIAGDTWMRRTEPYTWQKYNGSSWEPMGGTVGRYDVLVASMLLLDGVTLTGDGSGRLIIKSQGVDTNELALNAVNALATFDHLDNLATPAPLAVAWADVKISLGGVATIAQVTATNSAATPAEMLIDFRGRFFEYNSQKFQLRLNDGTNTYPIRQFDGSGWGAGFDGPKNEACAWKVTLPAGTTRTYTLQGVVSGWSPSDPGIMSAIGIWLAAVLYKKV